MDKIDAKTGPVTDPETDPKTDLQKAILARYEDIARRYARSRGREQADSSTGQSSPYTGESGLGCARLSALVQLFPGETILDLGSGPGLETIALARLVDPAPAYGLDALASMVEVATENARQAGVSNVRFLAGPMEAIPLEDTSVDVVVSNCVINLSQNKERVMGEAYRVLRPGGRLAIADMVWLGDPPSWARNTTEAWACCVGGALEAHAFPDLLRRAGFSDVNVRILWTLDPAALSGSCSADSSASCCGPSTGPECCSTTADGTGSCCSSAPVGQSSGDPILASAFVTARKPRTGRIAEAGPRPDGGWKPGVPVAGVQVREAASRDLHLVLRILQAAGLPTAGVAEHLSSFLLARTRDGNVVGLVGLERHPATQDALPAADRSREEQRPGPAALLRSLVVLPSWRGQGLGRHLVASLIARLHPRTPVYLLTTTAEAYFRRLGFQAVPRQEAPAEVRASAEFQGACPQTATLMRLACAAELRA